MIWGGMTTGTGREDGKHTPLPKRSRMHGGSMTCTAMSGSGAMTGMEIILSKARLIQRDLHRATLVCCAAAAGAAVRGAAAPRTASGTFLTAASTTMASASVAPQNRVNEERINPDAVIMRLKMIFAHLPSVLAI